MKIESKEDVLSICIDLGLSVRQFSIKNDLSIDLDEEIILRSRNFTEFPIKIRYCQGLDLVNTKIESWINFPDIIHGDLIMRSTNVSSLIGMPEIVLGTLSLRFTPISSLRGISQIINGAVTLKNQNFVDAMEYRYILLSNVSGGISTGFLKIDEILTSGRVNGIMPSELIPGKIKQLRDIGTNLRGNRTSV